MSSTESLANLVWKNWLEFEAALREVCGEIEDDSTEKRINRIEGLTADQRAMMHRVRRERNGFTHARKDIHLSKKNKAAETESRLSSTYAKNIPLPDSDRWEQECRNSIELLARLSGKFPVEERVIYRSYPDSILPTNDDFLQKKPNVFVAAPDLTIPKWNPEEERRQAVQLESDRRWLLRIVVALALLWPYFGVWVAVGVLDFLQIKHDLNAWPIFLLLLPVVNLPTLLVFFVWMCAKVGLITGFIVFAFAMLILPASVLAFSRSHFKS